MSERDLLDRFVAQWHAYHRHDPCDRFYTDDCHCGECMDHRNLEYEMAALSGEYYRMRHGDILSPVHTQDAARKLHDAVEAMEVQWKVGPWVRLTIDRKSHDTTDAATTPRAFSAETRAIVENMDKAFTARMIKERCQSDD